MELENLREPRGCPTDEQKMARLARAQKELMITKDTDVSTWNELATLAWLDRIGMGKYRRNFEEDRITGRKLLNMTAHTMADVGVKRKDRPMLLKELDDLRNLCVESNIPGSNGVILDFAKRPFDFEIEWYNYTLTVTEINARLEKS